MGGHKVVPALKKAAAKVEHYSRKVMEHPAGKAVVAGGMAAAGANVHWHALEEIGQGDEVVDSESEEADEESEAEGDEEEDMEKLHRRRRGTKFGHKVVPALKKAAEKVEHYSRKVMEHPAGKAVVAGGMAAAGAN